MRAKRATSEEGTRGITLKRNAIRNPAVVSEETPLILPKPEQFGIVLFFTLWIMSLFAVI